MYKHYSFVSTINQNIPFRKKESNIHTKTNKSWLEIISKLQDILLFSHIKVNQVRSQPLYLLCIQYRYQCTETTTYIQIHTQYNETTLTHAHTVHRDNTNTCIQIHTQYTETRILHAYRYTQLQYNVR